MVSYIYRSGRIHVRILIVSKSLLFVGGKESGDNDQDPEEEHEGVDDEDHVVEYLDPVLAEVRHLLHTKSKMYECSVDLLIHPCVNSS
jgi:hypothetical protein